MCQIILEERTDHLGSYTFLQEMLINIKKRCFHSSNNHQERLLHRTLINGYFHPADIAKFLMDFFIERLQKQLLADIPQNRYS